MEAFASIRVICLCRYYDGGVILANTAARSAKELGVPLFMLLVLASTFSQVIYEVEWDTQIDHCMRLWEAEGVPRSFMRNPARTDGVTWDCSICTTAPQSIECLTCHGYPGTATKCAGLGWAQTFDSVPNAMWFVGVSMTTVGYGDQTPATPQGQCLCGVIIICGVLFFAMMLAPVGQAFSDVWANRHMGRLCTLTRQLLTENGLEHDAEGVMRAFSSADANNRGVVDSREFEIFAKDTLTMRLDALDYVTLWKQLDLNGSGSLTITEFAAVVFPDIDKKEVLMCASSSQRRAVISDLDAEKAMDDPELLDRLIRTSSHSGALVTGNESISSGSEASPQSSEERLRAALGEMEVRITAAHRAELQAALASHSSSMADKVDKLAAMLVSEGMRGGTNGTARGVRVSIRDDELFNEAIAIEKASPASPLEKAMQKSYPTEGLKEVRSGSVGEGKSFTEGSRQRRHRSRRTRGSPGDVPLRQEPNGRPVVASPTDDDAYVA